MNGWLGWLDDNSQLLSAMASLAMTIIWVVCLQIALTSFRRQRRPRLIISQAQRRGIQSSFMLINLSQEPVHIGCILVAINVGQEEQLYEITDIEHSAVDPHSDSEKAGSREDTLRYGPVQAGSFLILGPASSVLSDDFNAQRGGEGQSNRWTTDLANTLARSKTSRFGSLEYSVPMIEP